MANNTVLNPGSGGDTLVTEDVGGGVKIAAGKLHTGAAGADGGPVTLGNPLAVQLSNGAGAYGTPSSPISVTVGDFPTTQAVTAAAGAEADGHSATLGFTSDGAWSGSGSGTAIAVLKAVWQRLRGGQQAMAVSLPVAIASDQPALPVSAATLPLPAGAAQDGADATGVSAPPGASGLRGWLSGIYKLLSGSIAASGSIPVGSVASGYPVLAGGSDGANVRMLYVTAAGYIGTYAQQRASVGSQGNLWNAAVVGAGGTSALVNVINGQPLVSIFGNASSATTITIYFSADLVHFYNTGTTIAANGDFALTLQTGAFYLRLVSSSACTITATATGKV
ncbi:MAG: hypothetical protein KGJ62_15435 [Armatimonadetes bacterium]|nr:hypothetical protein [Armatimonadota bacterium]MDE2207484.1 hypothetical protein [Armatimonadota bacterium]